MAPHTKNKKLKVKSRYLRTLMVSFMFRCWMRSEELVAAPGFIYIFYYYFSQSVCVWGGGCPNIFTTYLVFGVSCYNSGRLVAQITAEYERIKSNV